MSAARAAVLVAIWTTVAIVACQDAFAGIVVGFFAALVTSDALS